MITITMIQNYSIVIFQKRFKCKILSISLPCCLAYEQNHIDSNVNFEQETLKYRNSFNEIQFNDFDCDSELNDEGSE